MINYFWTNLCLTNDPCCFTNHIMLRYASFQPQNLDIFSWIQDDFEDFENQESQNLIPVESDFVDY